MGASDENECLRNDGDLKVDDGVQLLIIVVDLVGGRIQMDMELALEEVRLEDDYNENDPTREIRNSSERRLMRNVRGKRQIETICYSVGENLGQIPTIWSRRWEHTVDGQRHDCAVIK